MHYWKILIARSCFFIRYPTVSTNCLSSRKPWRLKILANDFDTKYKHKKTNEIMWINPNVTIQTTIPLRFESLHFRRPPLHLVSVNMSWRSLPCSPLGQVLQQFPMMEDLLNIFTETSLFLFLNTGVLPHGIWNKADMSTVMFK
jgi:hypothetical protein